MRLAIAAIAALVNRCQYCYSTNGHHVHCPNF
jgi:hypothetical protein